MNELQRRKACDNYSQLSGIGLKNTGNFNSHLSCRLAQAKIFLALNFTLTLNSVTFILCGDMNECMIHDSWRHTKAFC